MNEILRETLDTLSAAGIEPEVRQSKHIKVSWCDPAGNRRLLVVSRSPSSRFALARNRAVLRRLLNTEV
jgi:hypothetical protein